MSVFSQFVVRFRWDLMVIALIFPTVFFLLKVALTSTTFPSIMPPRNVIFHLLRPPHTCSPGVSTVCDACRVRYFCFFFFLVLSPTLYFRFKLQSVLLDAPMSPTIWNVSFKERKVLIASNSSSSTGMCEYSHKYRLPFLWIVLTSL